MTGGTAAGNWKAERGRESDKTYDIAVDGVAVDRNRIGG